MKRLLLWLVGVALGVVILKRPPLWSWNLR